MPISVIKLALNPSSMQYKAAIKVYSKEMRVPTIMSRAMIKVEMTELKACFKEIMMQKY